MTTLTDGRIAIVSAALRLPGASDLAGFRSSLGSGSDAISRDPHAAPDSHELPLGLPANARFVSAYGNVGAPMAFDHERFGMSASEALLTDPQQRLLLELADEALHTGSLSARVRAATAVFVGTGLSAYESEVRQHLGGAVGVDDLGLELGTARDYVAGKIAYRLDLQGPALTVLGACATGLLAVHLGRRSLLAGEADAVLAGAAAVRYPLQRGYWAVPGTISAPDGVCRPFDSRAGGTVPADGAAVVVLKRLQDALSAGDDVLAVIRGSAASNDGRKPGFAGVSAAAQYRVIERALRDAGLAPGAIRYVESHGAGTRLGDAVEWSALQHTFGTNQDPVLVGAVKGHIGHTREAAGMAGLLKAVLAVSHGEVSPTTNFVSLPGDLVVGGSPVQPVAAATTLDLHPGAAVGVSAFGLGGYNCHLIIEPAPKRRAGGSGGPAVLLLSSHREDTLDADTRMVCQRMEAVPEDVPALAARSQRRPHPHAWRRWIDASEGLTGGSPPSARALARSTRRAARRPQPVAFAFPGVGSEHLGMAAGLVESCEVFAVSFQQSAVRAREAGADITGLTASGSERTERVNFRQLLAGAGSGQPATGLVERHLALHAVQLAFVDLLADAGVHPAAVMGHSLGEWTAATVAGAIDRADACRFIARRAQLIDQAGRGATIAVAESADVVVPLLPPGLTLAAENSPQSCTISGSREAADALALRLTEKGIVFHRLATDTAFHNDSLSEASQRFGEELAAHRWGELAVPMVSSVDGCWVRAGQIDAAYWRGQLISPVLFGRAVQSVAQRCRMIVEIGPGNTRPWVSQTVPDVVTVRTSRTAYEGTADRTVFERALAELWLHGHDPLWPVPVVAPIAGADPPPALVRRVVDPRSAGEPDDVADTEADTVDPSPPRVPATWGAQHATLGTELASLWCALLGVPRAEPGDHFFDLGGDSLLGRHLIAMIQNLTATEVPPSVVFASGSLQGMTDAVHAWLSDVNGGRP